MCEGVDTGLALIMPDKPEKDSLPALCLRNPSFCRSRLGDVCGTWVRGLTAEDEPDEDENCPIDGRDDMDDALNPLPSLLGPLSSTGFSTWPSCESIFALRRTSTLHVESVDHSLVDSSKPNIP